MIIRRHNGREVSPSIVSKVKHALGLKRTEPQNDKVCSKELWDEVVDIMGASMNCMPATIEQAKLLYDQYMDVYFADSAVL